MQKSKLFRIDLVKVPVITQKSVGLRERNKITFDVDPKLTKPNIKALIEKLFSVKVIAVNTHIPPRKKRGVGNFKGYRPQYKRAIVTVDSIIPFLDSQSAWAESYKPGVSVSSSTTAA